MSVQKGLNNREIVKQSIELTHASSPLSRAEIDLILTLISQIKQEDENFKEYVFTTQDLEKKMNKKIHSKQLQNLALNLLQKPLLLPVEGTLNSDRWVAVSWFSHFEYINGNISCAFNERLKPYLLQIKGRHSLGTLKRLLPMKSKYGKELYLLLSAEAFRGFYEVEVEKLQKKLKVPKSLYIYNNFKTKVIEQAKKDLDKFSDISFTIDEIKQGKKVHKIKFNIKRNLEDLKVFISVIREHYVNVPLAETKEGMTLQCSKKGYLYYKENPTKDIHPKTAQTLWEKLHDKRDELIIFKENADKLLEEAERKLKGQGK